MRVLGIDPGIGIVGFGLVQKTKAHPKMLDVGCVKTTVGASMPLRLKELYDSMVELLEQTRPDVVAVEKLFFAQNITTAMTVSQARGVILLSVEQAGVPVYEYAPLQIKMAMTGYGRAAKAQIQEMVRVQLKLKKKPTPDDAADALAVALTHLTTFHPPN